MRRDSELGVCVFGPYSPPLAPSRRSQAEYGDNHDHPNVDVQYVAFNGFAVRLPEDVRAL